MMHARAPPAYSDAPPDYGEASGSGPAKPLTGIGLQAMDFLPRMTAEDGPSNRPEYESFSLLVDRANAFLRQNPHWTVSTCESVEFRAFDRGRNIDTVGSVFTAYGEANNRYIRGLRLWAQLRPPASGPPVVEQIGYRNVLPEIRGDQVERLDGVVHRINSIPFQGRVITVETQPIKWGSSGLDPDRTIWTERGSARETFVNLIRIFYIMGPVQHAEVGLADFVPAMLDQGGAFSNPRMETFPTVMQRVRQWLLSVPPNYRPVNVQTVMFRWSYNKGIDTKDMTYHENKKHLNYLRYLRVGYIVENPADGPISRSTIQLGSKLVVPGMSVEPGCCEDGAFESQDSCRQRVDVWVKAAGARVVSAETLVMRIAGGGESVYGFDAMHTWNDTHQTRSSNSSSTKRDDERFVYLYRIYTDGIVPERATVEDMQLQDYTRRTDSGEGCTIL
ncbi:uncharacterized protein LOC129590600 [Paramacrobiotus metropolitanus]|uniref:uncharacterized protein LOC129590600 n=1 Tax=Paramacrobiotus metropolitanus TaxID=2943436 RepID=UPI002445762A|nr:uncharacterized protein LOC129590600 [Paramacrobiotus metropolitanus]